MASAVHVMTRIRTRRLIPATNPRSNIDIRRRLLFIEFVECELGRGSQRGRSIQATLSPLLAVEMHVDALPHAIHVIGVALREGIDGGAIRRLDDEQAADRRLAVLVPQRAGGKDLDAVLT